MQLPIGLPFDLRSDADLRDRGSEEHPELVDPALQLLLVLYTHEVHFRHRRH